jgi:hypothetical protein
MEAKKGVPNSILSLLFRQPELAGNAAIKSIMHIKSGSVFQ